VSGERYIVWLGGTNGANFNSYAEAEAFAKEYTDEGYDDVVIETVNLTEGEMLWVMFTKSKW
jgi:hypothetical protein